MKREVGLWIDHHKAVMVTMINDREETREIRSNVEKYIRFPDGLHTKEPKIGDRSNGADVSANKYGDHLRGYFDGVLSMLRNADTIWIFGPGNAKVELKNRLDREELGERIISVEAENKMTNRQIEAKVRLHFQQ